MDAREYLRGLLYPRKSVDDWIAERVLPGERYDAQLGYVPRDHMSREGGRSSFLRPKARARLQAA